MNKISVYTVFKRYPLNFLEECINGLNQQSFDEYVFLVYGTDNDLTGITKVLSKCNFEYKFRYTPEIELFIDAIRYAVGICTHDYVLRADSEDILMEGAIRKMMLNKDIVIPNYIPMDINGKCGTEVKGNVNKISSNCVISKRLWNSVKFHSFQVCRDGWSIQRTLQALGIECTYLDQPLFFYRQNLQGLTNNTRSKHVLQWNERLVNNMYDYNLDTSEIVIDENEYYIITNKQKIRRKK
jgi:hypothetical protein